MRLFFYCIYITFSSLSLSYMIINSEYNSLSVAIPIIILVGGVLDDQFRGGV